MKFGHLLAGFGIAAGLFSLTLGSLHLASAAPDNSLGMALMSAVVDGFNPPHLIRGAGAVSVNRDSEGFFDVLFDRDVSNCTCTVSGGYYLQHVSGANYNALANCPFSSTGVVRVVTQYYTGALTDAPFHLIVFCPK